MASKAKQLAEHLESLTERQRAVVAISRAHPQWTAKRVLLEAGYSESTAKAGTLMGKPGMRRALELARELDTRAASYGAAELRADLLELASADLLDVFDDETGRMLPPGRWPAAVRRRIKALKMNELGGVESVTFEPLLPVLQTLGKHRAIQAFSETHTERRVYVLRDFTGAADARPAIDVSPEGQGHEQQGEAAQRIGRGDERTPEGAPIEGDG